mgnify:CR=1 FL=1
MQLVSSDIQLKVKNATNDERQMEMKQINDEFDKEL